MFKLKYVFKINKNNLYLNTNYSAGREVLRA